MKMHKILLSDYPIVVKTPDGDKEVDYRVVDSVIAVLFHPDLKLGGKELLKRGKLADKIEECKEDSILLTPEEYSKVKESFDVVKGFGKNDIELVRRVEECEEVEVTVSEEGKK